MKKKQKTNYLLAIVLSIILYVLGVYTGVKVENYFSTKIYSELELMKTDMQKIKQSTDNLYIQQLLLLSVDKEKTCPILVSSLKEIEQNLKFYWDRLPKRLEEYEKYEDVTKEYENLKKDYMTISLKAWSISSLIKKDCDPSLIPILYFYSRNCEKCIDQGVELDKLKQLVISENKTVMVFTVDYDLSNPNLNVIKVAYNITETPSMIIEDKIINGFANVSYLLGLI